MKKKVIIFIVIAVVILVGVAIWYFYFRNNTAPAPAPYTAPVSDLPSCSSIQKTCRAKCINKWWIPVVGITEYQKCMDTCYVNNPCI